VEEHPIRYLSIHKDKKGQKKWSSKGGKEKLSRPFHPMIPTPAVFSIYSADK